MCNPVMQRALFGSSYRTVPAAAQPTPSTMPAYDWKLSDTEIAAVASYVRNDWANAAGIEQVKTLRLSLGAKSD